MERTVFRRTGVPAALSTKVMDLLPKVVLLNQSHLANHGVVTLVHAFRKPRLVTILSLTLSRSPQLLPQDVFAPVVVASHVFQRSSLIDI